LRTMSRLPATGNTTVPRPSNAGGLHKAIIKWVMGFVAHYPL
jgi:hypothetical protein